MAIGISLIAVRCTKRTGTSGLRRDMELVTLTRTGRGSDESHGDATAASVRQYWCGGGSRSMERVAMDMICVVG